MANLDPVADKAVRDAVDAFMEGTLRPDFTGETVFETKNSRYRLLDGVVFAAPDPSLVGAELVGWLVEGSRRAVVESAWLPGSRAVLVDRSRGRNIVVTSTTRLLHLDDSSSEAFIDPPVPPIPASVPRPMPAPIPAFSPRSAPIIPSTPPPPMVGIPPSRPPSRPPAASPIHNAAIAIPAAKRAPAIHLPPRPIAPRSAASSPIPALPRPLPVPGHAPPPRYEPQVNANPPPPAPADEWELTSGELEIEEDSAEVETARAPHLYASRYDTESPESAGVPIPLVRPVRR